MQRYEFVGDMNLRYKGDKVERLVIRLRVQSQMRYKQINERRMK